MGSTLRGGGWGGQHLVCSIDKVCAERDGMKERGGREREEMRQLFKGGKGEIV